MGGGSFCHTCARVCVMVCVYVCVCVCVCVCARVRVFRTKRLIIVITAYILYYLHAALYTLSCEMSPVSKCSDVSQIGQCKEQFLMN